MRGQSEIKRYPRPGALTTSGTRLSALALISRSPIGRYLELPSDWSRPAHSCATFSHGAPVQAAPSIPAWDREDGGAVWPSHPGRDYLPYLKY